MEKYLTLVICPKQAFKGYFLNLPNDSNLDMGFSSILNEFGVDTYKQNRLTQTLIEKPQSIVSSGSVQLL